MERPDKYIPLIFRCLFISWGFPFLLSAQLSDFKGVDFHKADSTALFHYNENLNDLPALSGKLTNGLKTDVERFRSIYLWVCSNIENDYLAARKNLNKREYLQNDTLELAEWNRDFSKSVFRKLILEKKTVCTGYAFLLRELCRHAGIPCRIIDGYARTASTHVQNLGLPNHSWNAVYLQDKWYLCDATWSSGITYKYAESSRFIFEFNEGYFLSSPEFFIKNHYPLDSSWTLLRNSPDLHQFINTPIIYPHTFKYGLNPLQPDTLNLKIPKGDTLIFTFQSYIEIDPECIYFETGGEYSRSRIIEPEVISYDNGQLKLMCRFYKRGLFDLHMKIEQEVLTSYTVYVHR